MGKKNFAVLYYPRIMDRDEMRSLYISHVYAVQSLIDMKESGGFI